METEQEYKVCPETTLLGINEYLENALNGGPFQFVHL